MQQGIDPTGHWSNGALIQWGTDPYRVQSWAILPQGFLILGQFIQRGFFPGAFIPGAFISWVFIPGVQLQGALIIRGIYPTWDWSSGITLYGIWTRHQEKKPGRIKPEFRTRVIRLRGIDPTWHWSHGALISRGYNSKIFLEGGVSKGAFILGVSF